MNQIAKKGWTTKVKVKFGGLRVSNRPKPLATKAGITVNRRKAH